MVSEDEQYGWREAPAEADRSTNNPWQQLLPWVHDELRRLAHSQRRRIDGGETLCTTALVNEAWFKFRQATPDGMDRQHFFGLAARAMRQVLIDHARRRGTQQRHVSSSDADLDQHPLLQRDIDRLLAIDQALDRLSEANPRLPQVVNCLFFAGYSEAETALAIGVNERTVRRDWIKARALLQHLLDGAA